jgi:hypothetical protein
MFVMPSVACYTLMCMRAVPGRGELQGDCRTFEDVTVHHNVESQAASPSHYAT